MTLVLPQPKRSLIDVSQTTLENIEAFFKHRIRIPKTVAGVPQDIPNRPNIVETSNILFHPVLWRTTSFLNTRETLRDPRGCNNAERRRLIEQRLTRIGYESVDIFCFYALIVNPNLIPLKLSVETLKKNRTLRIFCDRTPVMKKTFDRDILSLLYIYPRESNGTVEWLYDFMPASYVFMHGDMTAVYTRKPPKPIL